MFQKGLNMYPSNDRFNPNGRSEVDQIDQDIYQMQRRRQELLDEAQTPKLPPAEFTMVALAHEAGEMTANYRAERERRERAVKQLNETTEKLRDLEGIQETADQWRSRAEAAEQTLKRSRAARRK